MKRVLFLLLAVTLASSAFAAKQAMEPWQDPNIFEENSTCAKITQVHVEGGRRVKKRESTSIWI